MQIWLKRLIDDLHIRGSVYCTVSAWPYPPVQISICTRGDFFEIWIVKFVDGRYEVLLNAETLQTARCPLYEIAHSLERLAQLEHTTLQEVSKRQQGVFMLKDTAHANDSNC